MSLGYIFLFVLFLPRGKGLERELGKGQSECAYITSATHTKTTHTQKNNNASVLQINLIKNRRCLQNILSSITVTRLGQV